MSEGGDCQCVTMCKAPRRSPSSRIRAWKISGRRWYGLSDVTVGTIPEVYQDVSTVTAGAADVLTGKVIVSASGTPVAGSMPNNGALALTIDGLTATSAAIPAGYTSGGTVSLTSDIEDALAAI